MRKVQRGKREVQKGMREATQRGIVAEVRNQVLALKQGPRMFLKKRKRLKGKRGQFDCKRDCQRMPNQVENVTIASKPNVAY